MNIIKRYWLLFVGGIVGTVGFFFRNRWFIFQLVGLAFIIVFLVLKHRRDEKHYQEAKAYQEKLLKEREEIDDLIVAYQWARGDHRPSLEEERREKERTREQIKEEEKRRRFRDALSALYEDS